MIEAGIQDGDYVIVRQQDPADPGDIVVVLLGDEGTSNGCGKKARRCFLRQPMPPTRQFR